MVSEARSWEQGARSGRRDRVKGCASRGAASSMSTQRSKSNSHQMSARRLAQAPLQKYSDGPEVGGPGFVAVAIDGAGRRIILLFEWSKNLLINQDPSGKGRRWGSSRACPRLFPNYSGK